MQLRSLFGKALALAAFGVAAAGSAHARDVYWSVGVQAAPGVSVGVANHRTPVYVQPAPVYVQPVPVYTPPPVVYTPPPVVYTPAPVYYAQPVYRTVAPAYYGPPGHHKHRKHWKKHGRGHHDD